MKALAKAIHKGWVCYHNYGAVETLCRLLYLFRIVSVQRSLDLFLIELAGSFDEIGHESSSGNGLLTIREVGVHEFEQLKYADGLQPIEWMREQFDRGSRLFAVIEKGRVIGVEWINSRIAELGHIMRVVELPHGIVYSHGVVVAPLYRNQGVGSLLKRYFLGHMRRDGVRFVMFAVFLENDGARRWHLKNGFQKWGAVTYLEFQGRKLWWIRLTSMGRQHPDLLKKEGPTPLPEGGFTSCHH